MKTKTPIGTYIITFLNLFFPPMITLVLAGAFVRVEVDEVTGELISKTTLLEQHTTALQAGAVLCIGITLFYYYLIKRGIIDPRWWMNVLLIVAGYAVFPFLALMIGTEQCVENAMESVTYNIAYIFPGVLIVFLVITFAIRRKPGPVNVSPQEVYPED